MSDQLKLPAESLRLKVNLDGFDFNVEIPDQDSGILGQSRAQDALQFGIAMQNPGYNVYVMGEPGTGRLSMVMNHLETLSHQSETPQAYIYVDNFENSREPVSVELPAGYGQTFCKDIEKLIDNLLATFPTAFENPAYQQKKIAMERRFNQRYNKAIDLVEKRSVANDIALYRDSETITFSPIRDNKSLDEEQFTQLPQHERDQFHKSVEELEDYLGDVLLELPQWRREMVEKIKELDLETISKAIDPLFNELNEKYLNIDDVITYLAEIRKDLGTTISDIFIQSQPLELQDKSARRQLLTVKYIPNILVDYKENSGAPVIFESHPIYPNLFGRIEYVSDQGALVTSFRQICHGSLHRANGGYLILDAEKILTYPFVWEALKRALKSGRIEIESPYSELGINTITLKPEVIRLDVKVVLVGSREIYYLLQDLDSEFNEMFRILADFDNHIQRTEDSMRQFAVLMVKQAAHTGVKPLTQCAVERLVEHSCRLAENQHRLSARINDSMEIIGEAELLRSQTKIETIDTTHIEQAIVAREKRSGRMAERQQEEMLEGTILIEIEGDAIGKTNGLTVMEISDSHFGAPARITVTVYPGSRGIVDIEREAELGQSIHSKGVMILTGYLGHSYAQQFPLAISASIAIEQSYGHIDGDSASLAELCTLISALTRIPIKQNFAVTGSINQYGEVQAIGGVNEKIESFFFLCRARKLTGDQGVIIPRVNRCNLMLKQEVVDAVAEGVFSIYAVSNVNETLEILTGLIAGDMDDDGNYPEGSINFRAVSRLKEISDLEKDKEESDKEV